MTGAALAVLLLAAAAAPAEAGFRYVPAGAVGAATVAGDTRAEEAGHAEPGPGANPASSGPSVSGASAWRVHAGETLRQALSRWGERAGAEVTFLTDRRYRLDGSAAFEGGFGDATAALLGGLAHLPHPPAGALSADGSSLAVTHRVRSSPEGESRP